MISNTATDSTRWTVCLLDWWGFDICPTWAKKGFLSPDGSWDGIHEQKAAFLPLTETGTPQHFSLFTERGNTFMLTWWKNTWGKHMHWEHDERGKDCIVVRGFGSRPEGYWVRFPMSVVRPDGELFPGPHLLRNGVFLKSLQVTLDQV